MYHGERWWSDERFQSPMALAKCGQVFTNDFIQFQHARHGITCGKIIKFYMKVINYSAGNVIFGYIVKNCSQQNISTERQS